MVLPTKAVSSVGSLALHNTANLVRESPQDRNGQSHWPKSPCILPLLRSSRVALLSKEAGDVWGAVTISTHLTPMRFFNKWDN